MNSNILLVGGAGYIGSHVFVELAEAGFTPIILDDFSRSNPSVIARLESITECRVVFEQGNAADTAFVREVLERHRIGGVVHFVARKSIAESFVDPVGHFRDNLGALASVLKAMDEIRCRKIIYSSTAAVYDPAGPMPVSEESPLAPSSPYAISKRMGEQMLASLGLIEPAWRIVILRYFNPVGAHPSAKIGEDPRGSPTNLMPRLCVTAGGRSDSIEIYGDDFPTSDGTGVRDFIHVVDLAKGHVAALQALDLIPSGEIFNLGTGRGHSVLELIAAFEKASGLKLRTVKRPRRSGDSPTCWADPCKARKTLGWTAELSIEDMCADAWRWYRSQAKQS